jgi:DsbC/DsbD-like thiol-disulfide interchange protein
MTYFRRTGLLVEILFFWFALLGVARAQLHELGDGSARPVKAVHVTAELMTGAPAVAQGGSTDIALILHLEPGWHVYWINAGDSGEAPNVEWVLPEGITIGKMQFPVPTRLPLGPLLDYGYEGTAVFPFDLHAANSVQVGETHLAAHVRWQVCRAVCVPGRAFLGVDLPLSAGQHASAVTGLIAAAMRAEPRSLPSGVSVGVSGTRDHLKLKIETGERETGAEFYPLDEDAIRNAAEQKVVPTAKGVQLTMERADISDTLPTRLRGVVKLSGGRAYSIDSPVQAMP